MSKHFIADIPQKAIITNNTGEILVVQDKGSEIWELPGGRLHDDEKPEDGLKRELREELFMEIDIKSIFDTLVFKSKSGELHFVVIYICEALGDINKMKIQEEEIKSIKWISKNDLKNLKIRDEYKRSLNKFFEINSKIHHDPQVSNDPFVKRTYKKTIKDLNTFFGINWKKDLPNIFTIDDRKTIDFLRNQKTEPWLVGWSEGNSKVFILSRKNFSKESNHTYSDKEYSSLIRHELCHLFFNKFTSGIKLPVWLNEGISIFTSGQLRRKKRPTKFIGFLDFYERGGSGLLYGESGFVVETLIKHYGKVRLFKLLKSLKKVKSEEDFKKMFKKVYGFPISYENINKIYK